LNGGPIIVKGDGTPYRSYLYAADLAIWLWTILFKGQSQRPYNVGSDQALTMKEVAQQVVECFSPQPQFEIRGKANARNAIERYVPSTTRVKTELDLNEWVSLPKSIESVIRSHQKNKL
jgi:dTDP-glucose 4,6-dehydratase